jgi:hypothetical protein
MLVLFLVVPACSHRPRAPALRDEPVYQNSQAGFRFLVPEGWTQTARAEAPPGKAESERMLVEYKLLTAAEPAALEVSLIDLPTATEVNHYLTSHPFSGEGWVARSQPQPCEINGVAAVRVELGNRNVRSKTTREVVYFQRGERVYFFTGIFAPTDASAREQVRRAVESIIWK